MVTGKGQAFQATNTRVARLNWRVGGRSVDPREIESLVFIFISSLSRLEYFILKDGCGAEYGPSAVAGLRREGRVDDALSCSCSQVSHFWQAVSNILRSVDGADGIIDHESRSSSALDKEYLSRMSLQKNSKLLRKRDYNTQLTYQNCTKGY